MKQLCSILLLILTSCEQPTNKEIALNFKDAEYSTNTTKYGKYLHKNVISLFADSSGIQTKEEILLNHKFNIPYEPRAKIISIEEPNDSTIKLGVIESNKLLDLFEIDSIGYSYLYTFQDRKITRIVIDSIPDYGFSHEKTGNAYNQKLNELMNWILENYPEEYEKIEQLDQETARMLIEMATLRKTQGNNG